MKQISFKIETDYLFSNSDELSRPRNNVCCVLPDADVAEPEGRRPPEQRRLQIKHKQSQAHDSYEL